MPDSTYFVTMMGGDLVEACISVLTDLIGGWFWVWFIGLSLFMMYNRTRDYATVAVVVLAVTVHIFPVFPLQVHLLAYVLLAIGITNILYKVYH